MVTDPFTARWHRCGDDAPENVTARFENGGWTVEATSSALQATYAVRCSATWQIRQLLVFRDADEPDLWLATDGHGRWGEVNGAHRPDLDGCTDVAVAGSALNGTVPIRRLALRVGDSGDVHTAVIDTEMLLVIPVRERFTRLGERRWRKTMLGADASEEWEVDEHGLALDLEGRFHRG